MEKAILFDMDGVIIDSEPVYFKALKTVFDEEGIAFTHKDHEDNMGLGMKGFWKKMKIKFNMPGSVEEYTQKTETAFLDLIHTEGKEVLGATAFIQKMHGKYKLAIASSAPRKNVEIIMDLLDLRKYFPVTVSGDDVKVAKPSPDIYLMTADKLGVEPSNCFVVEDAVAGIASGKNAGMKCIGITTNLSMKRLKETEADLVVEGFDEINEEILEGL